MRWKAAIVNLFIFTLLGSTSLELAAQSKSVLADTAGSTAQNALAEKLHLHFDKPFYSSGDTIWFKSYLVDRENKLTEHSKLLYVDLIDNSTRIIKTLKVPLSAGLGWADIPLDKEMPAGNYRVRAYTAWMRNFGEELFFDEVIPVTDIFEKQVTTTVNYNYKGHQLQADLQYKNLDGTPLAGKEVKYSIYSPGKRNLAAGKGVTDASGQLQVLIDTASLSQATLLTNLKTEIDTVSKSFVLPDEASHFDAQFFPEGGVLVNNIPSRLGFKVTGANGLGMKASGYITDNFGTQIAAFETEFAGMGMLALNPQSGQTYTAHVTSENGIENTFVMPKALNQGYVITVTEDEDNILIKTRVSNDFQAKSITLKVVSQGKELINSSNVLREAQLTIKVLKTDLPSGIARLSLFSAEGTPVAERLFFVDHSDQLNIRVDSLKEQYSSRSKVTPKIVVTDNSGNPVLAHMSMTVVDESKVPYDDSDETSILSNLLLSSELKGYIEKPNYYFSGKNKDKKQQLDILMMTQGWRKFEFRQQTANAVFTAENGLTVKGKVLSPFNAPLPNAEVSLIIQGAAPIFRKAYTDTKGEFTFDTLSFENIAYAAISAKNSKGSSNVNITIDTVSAHSVSKLEFYRTEDMNRIEGILVPNLDNENLEYLKKYADLNKTQVLSEVVVRAARPRLLPNSTNLTGRDAMYTFLEKDLLNYTRLSDVVQAKVPGIGIKRLQRGETVAVIMRKGQASMSGPMFMQVYLDGVPAGNDLDQYNLNDFDGIEVLNRDVEFAPYGTIGAGGVILLTSRTSLPKDRQPMGNIRVKVAGYAPERQFYSPKYDGQIASSQGRDVRSTIYWDPNILISGGVNTDASFYTADKAGTYRFIIEGIDEFGRLGRKVFTKNINLQAAQVFAKNPVQKSSPAADSSSKGEIIEKVHLHFDRPFYSAGDTIWFKAYLVESGTSLTKHSGLLYVDLLSNTDEIIESIKVPLSAGLGWANFNLSEYLPGGNYRVRAYTSWMRNFGDGGFFNKIIPVSDIFESQIATNAKFNYSGGLFIADLEYKDIDGQPLAARNVKYTIPREGKRTISGKGETDINGQLQIRLDTADLSNARNIVAGLKIEKDTIFKNFEIPINARSFDAQFFPEGGTLVTSIPSRLGFKITGAGGLGLKASGYIADETDAKVGEFKTEFAGMGSVEVNPQAGKTYTAYVRLDNGVETAILLPKPLDQGIVMTVTQDAKDIIAHIKSSTASGAGIRLQAGSHAKVTYSSTHILTTQDLSIRVPKKNLPPGITRFTLTKDSQPVAERIVFVDQPEKLLINFDSLQASYSTTSKVVPGISSATSAGKPVTAHFSLAVVDDGKVPYDESDELTVFSNLLLSSELKGYIEKPNYYFTETSAEKIRHLDNLMLTQGWRKFETPTLKYNAETGLAVKGRLLTPLKTPVPNAPVRLMIQREGEGFKNTLADANGEFAFENLDFKNRVKMILSASNAAGKANVAIKIDSVAAAAPVSQLDYRRPNFLVAIDSGIIAGKDGVFVEQLKHRANLNQVQQLEEVRVVSSRVQGKAISSLLTSPASYTFLEKEIEKSSNLGDFILNARVPGLTLDIYGRPNYSVFLDDLPLEATDFYLLNTNDIAAIEIVTNLSHMTIYGPKRRAIFITSRKDGPKTKSPELGQLDYFAQGFQPDRQFYSPRYDNPKKTPLADLRTTIYWNPDVLTLNGKGPEIDFFTAAKPGKYRFIIEGIDTEGRLGRKVIVKEIK